MTNVIKGEGFNEIELEKNTIENTICLNCKDGCIALTATQPFASYLVMKSLEGRIIKWQR